MDWLTDHLQILVILAAVIGGIWNKFSDWKKQAEEKTAPPPLRRAPRSASPPPIPRAPREIPAVSPAMISQEETENLLRRQAEMRDRLQAAKAAKRAEAAKSKSGRSTPSLAIGKPSLTATLKNRGELRRAFILKEILDPPAGLR